MRWVYHNRYILSVFFLSLLPFFFWFSSSDLVHTHDGLVHLPRIAAFYRELTSLNIPVRWASDLNYGYGMPLFVFIYHLPYLVASLFLALGFGLVHAFKLSLLLSFLLSGFSMYLFSKRFFNDQRIALLVTLLYQFAPFHLVDLLIRGSFGEVYTYAFLPLTLYCLVSFFQTLRIRFLVFTAISTALLVISHNSISLLFFGILVLFVLLFGKTIRQRLFTFLGLALGLGLSGYYWIPALLEHRFTYGDLYMKDLFRTHFPDIWKLFIPNLTDTKILQADNLSLTVGLVQLVAVICGFIWFARSKKKENEKKRVALLSFLLILGSVIFMLPVSLPLWEKVSFLRQFQFPWRFLTVTVFASSMLGVFLYPFIKKSMLYIFTLVVIILSSFIYWIPKEGLDTIDEYYYWNFPLTTTYYGETDVIWSAGPAKEYPKKRIELIAGEGNILSQTVEPGYQVFTVEADTDITLVSHTQYFPGWRVHTTDDNVTHEIPIQFQDPNQRGLITFTLPKGFHTGTIVFGESKVRLAADFISLGSSILLLVSSILFWRKTL